MSNDADSVPAGGVDEAVGTDDDKAFGYRGKYNWDDSQCNKHPTNEKATIVPSGGEIVDYSWCDGKRYVSMYVELRGLDDVADDDLEASLLNDGMGVVFSAKSVTGKDRYLRIENLYGKVKRTKLVRKRGKDRVIIKLVKDDEKRKWYNLKGAGKSTSHGYDDYDDDDDNYDRNNGGDMPWIPQEDEMALDDMLDGGMDDDNDDETPMEDVEEGRDGGGEG